MIAIFLHQELTLRSGQRHDEIIVGGVALIWIFGERDADGFVGRL